MIDIYFKVVLLYDIGKVGIFDNILFKLGKLILDEFIIMCNYVLLGKFVFEKVEKFFGVCIVFINVVKEIVMGYYEKWDGLGYLLGFKGDDIFLSVCLMVFVDVYDVLICCCVYKELMSYEEVKVIIL